MIEYIVNNFYKLSTGIFMACFTAWLGWRTWNKTLRITATDKFHDTIISTLEGIFPDTRYWDKDIDTILRKSIIPIETAALRYQRFVTRQADFDAALQYYKDCCNRTFYNDVVAFKLYPTSRKKDAIGPEETFKKAVNDLLEFAKKP